MEGTNRAELKILSRTENIGLARLAVAAFAAQLDFTLTEIEEIKMAISEAVTNSIIHGYSQKLGIIKINMEQEDDLLILEVIDNGMGMAQGSLNKAAGKSAGEGLGLIFINNFMDSVHIESEANQGTRIRMSIRSGKEDLKNKGASSNA